MQCVKALGHGAVCTIRARWAAGSSARWVLVFYQWNVAVNEKSFSNIPASLRLAWSGKDLSLCAEPSRLPVILFQKAVESAAGQSSTKKFTTSHTLGRGRLLWVHSKVRLPWKTVWMQLSFAQSVPSTVC
jgi:hypothetical protein